MKKIYSFFKDNINDNLYFLFFLGMIVSCFELIGMSLLLPVFQPSYDGELVKYIKLFFSFISIEYTILSLSVLILLVFLLKFIISIIQEFKYHKVSNIFLSNVRKKLVSLIAKSDFLKVNRYSFSEINNLLTKETEKVYELFFYIMQLSIVGTLMIGYLILALMLNIKYTLVMVLFGFFMMFFYRKLNKRVKYYSYEIINKSEVINKYLTELIIYLRYLKVTSSIDTYEKYMNDASDNYSHVKFKQAFLGGLTKRSSEPIGILMILLMVTYNNLYESSSNIEIAFVALFLYKVFTTFTNLQYTYQKIISVKASILRIIDFKSDLENQTIENNNMVILNNKINIIELNNLNFKITDIPIMNNISYTFEKGKIYGLVGNTGAGKTTLINLISGLYKPDNCQVNFNKIDVNKIDFSLLNKKIGYVSQDNFIFEDTLLNNITSWQEDKIKDVFEFVDMCELNTLVNDIGIDSKISSFGGNLSGGQKQRICLARELIKKPELLILDEATSALDSNTEKKIMNNIIKLKNNNITIIIAHRLSTLMKVDEILFLDNGTIKDSGNMKDLYNINSQFKKMCNNQNIYLENHK